MTTELVLFTILGIVAVAAAVAVVTAKNPVHAVLYLVINFFAIAMFYLILSAQFIAFLQILVYAGAIMVLFLFVVMLLNMTGAIEAVRDRLPAQRWIALIFAVGLLVEVGLIVSTGIFKAVPAGTPLPLDFGTSKPVAAVLFSRYLLPFEVTSVLLLIAMVGSIVLARKKVD